MKKFSALFVGYLLLASVGLVNATPIIYSYDFSTMGYTEGEIFENKTIDLAAFTSEPGYSNNFVYTNSYGGGLYVYPAGDADIYINFSQAVDMLSFTAGDGGGDFDAFAVSLYEFGTNNFLGTFNTPLFGGLAEPEWFTLNLTIANVGRAVFDPGNSGILPGVAEGNLDGGVILTESSYRGEPIAVVTVPTPATIPLLGIALAALGFSHRKRKVHSYSN